MDRLQKVYFKLKRDRHGYPPDDWESLWARKVNSDILEIDNIPFYAKGVSSEDLVRVEVVGGRSEFREVLKPSGNSVLRLYIFDKEKVASVRSRLRSMGVESELSDILHLIALEIPRSQNARPVLSFLQEGKEDGAWDIQEGVLRHTLGLTGVAGGPLIGRVGNPDQEKP